MVIFETCQGAEGEYQTDPHRCSPCHGGEENHTENSESVQLDSCVATVKCFDLEVEQNAIFF